MYDNDEVYQGSKAILWWGLAIVVVLVVAVLIFASIRPQILEMQAQANQSSDQYITARVTHLQGLMSDYLRLDREIADFGGDESDSRVSTRQAQQANIITEMHQVVSLVGPGFIPESIRQFLVQHPLGG